MRKGKAWQCTKNIWELPPFFLSSSIIIEVMHRYYIELQSKLWWFSFHQAQGEEWAAYSSAFSLPRFVNCLTSVHKQSATIKCFYISACQIRGQKAGRIVCGIRGRNCVIFHIYKVYTKQRQTVLKIWWVSKNLRRCAPPLPFTLWLRLIKKAPKCYLRQPAPASWWPSFGSASWLWLYSLTPSMDKTRSCASATPSTWMNKNCRYTNITSALSLETRQITSK